MFDLIGLFIGVNDGVSGVVLLLELGEYMGELECDFGVDFVFFDGEEFVFDCCCDLFFIGLMYFVE